MPAEDASPSLPFEKPRKQFSLSSLFFFLLFVSPLFLSLRFVRELLGGRVPDEATVYRVLAFAAVYGGIFAWRGEIRKRRHPDKGQSGPDVSAPAEGGAYGLLFAIMALGPVVGVGILDRNGAFGLGKAALTAAALHLYGECLWEFLLSLFVVAFEGLLLGAIGGFVAGAALRRRSPAKSSPKP